MNELRSNGYDADMLNVTEGGRFGERQDRARFNINAKVMRRLEMTQQKPLYRIYGNDGAQQLKKIVDAMLKELKRDG